MSRSRTSILRYGGVDVDQLLGAESDTEEDIMADGNIIDILDDVDTTAPVEPSVGSSSLGLK